MILSGNYRAMTTYRGACVNFHLRKVLCNIINLRLIDLLTKHNVWIKVRLDSYQITAPLITCISLKGHSGYFFFLMTNICCKNSYWHLTVMMQQACSEISWFDTRETPSWLHILGVNHEIWKTTTVMMDIWVGGLMGREGVCWLLLVGNSHALQVNY